MGDVLGRQVVVTTSRDRDVLSLGKLQEGDYGKVNIAVHSEAPRLRIVQKIEQIFCCWVSNGGMGRKNQQSHPSASLGEAPGNPCDTTQG